MVNYALVVMLWWEAQAKSYVVIEGEGHELTMAGGMQYSGKPFQLNWILMAG